MKDSWGKSGKIFSGTKQGPYFAQLNWVQKQCLQKLGFRPYPETLNLEIAAENAAILETVLAGAGIELFSNDSSATRERPATNYGGKIVI